MTMGMRIRSKSAVSALCKRCAAQKSRLAPAFSIEDELYFWVVVLELVLCPASPPELPGPREAGFSRSPAPPLLLPEKPLVAPP